MKDIKIIKSHFKSEIQINFQLNIFETLMCISESAPFKFLAKYYYQILNYNKTLRFKMQFKLYLQESVVCDAGGYLQSSLPVTGLDMDINRKY